MPFPYTRQFDDEEDDPNNPGGVATMDAPPDPEPSPEPPRIKAPVASLPKQSGPRTLKQRILGGGPAPSSAMTPGFNGQPVRMPVPGAQPQGSDPNALPPVPQFRQPGILQRVASAALSGAAGYVNASGRTHIDPATIQQAQQNIKYPGLGNQMAQYEAQTQRVKDQAALGKTAADTAHANASAKYATQQAATLEAEGKRKPKDALMAVPAGQGLYDAEKREWVQQPTDKSQLTVIDEDTARAYGIKPLADGTYAVPNSAVGSLISNQKPREITTLEHRAVQILSDPELSPEAKQSQLEEVAKAHNILHPQTPIHQFESDDKGNVTMVMVDPSKPGAFTKVPVGPIGKTKTQPAPGVTLTPEAITQAASLYQQTGNLPSLGMGSAGAAARSQILNEAGKSGANIAANKSDYRANSGSLAGLQKQYDQVMAFERTATKNLDIAAGLSSKVDRMGSPLINRWVLAAKGQVAGDADTRAFEAAVQTAANEYAKVVTSNGASGSVTDSARNEYSKILNAADNPKAFAQVVALMKQEMGNRRSGFEDQIGEMRGRSSGQQPAQSGPKVGDVVNVRGKQVKISAIHSDGTFDGNEVKQ